LDSGSECRAADLKKVAGGRISDKHKWSKAIIRSVGRH
jgi:hypothetical protein